MSNKFLVTPIKEAELGRWNIDLIDYIEKLKKEWPDSNYEILPDDEIAAYIVVDGWKLWFRLYGKQRLLIESGSPAHAAFLAEWFRKIIPEQAQVFLVEFSMGTEIELALGMTNEQILNAINSHLFGKGIPRID